jgi:hypothetical protein
MPELRKPKVVLPGRGGPIDRDAAVRALLDRLLRQPLTLAAMHGAPGRDRGRAPAGPVRDRPLLPPRVARPVPMPRPNTHPRVVVRRFQLTGWRATVFLAIAAFVTVTLVTLFGVLFLVAFPVLLVAGFAMRHLLAKEPEPPAEAAGGGRVIEGSYEVRGEGREPPAEAIAAEQAERADRVAGPEPRVTLGEADEPPERPASSGRVETPRAAPPRP